MYIVSKINRLVALAVLHANEFLVSKETVVPRRWERSKQSEGLTLETSAF